MTKYLLRNDRGEIVAELPSDVGMDILTSLEGKWSTTEYADGLSVQRYTLKEGRVLRLSNDDFELTLMLWKGMMLDLTDLTNTPYSQVI